jgi:hypothetical protein
MGSTGDAAVFDPMYFLMNSVPTEWRRENELALLNAYYDKLIESPFVQTELYPWPAFMMECQLILMQCAGAAAERMPASSIRLAAR